MLDRRLRITAIVLAVIGVGIGTYLTYIHYAGIDPVCSIAHGCIKVQTSEWSKFHGVAGRPDRADRLCADSRLAAVPPG